MIFNLLVAIRINLYLMKEGEILYQGLQRRPSPLSQLQTVYGVQSQVTWTKDQQAMIHYL